MSTSAWCGGCKVRSAATVRAFHDVRVQELTVAALEADERHGFSGDKTQAAWEAEVLDPQSKLVLAHVQIIKRREGGRVVGA